MITTMQHWFIFDLQMNSIYKQTYFHKRLLSHHSSKQQSSASPATLPDSVVNTQLSSTERISAALNIFPTYACTLRTNNICTHIGCSHFWHGQDQTVWSCPCQKCEHNWRQDKTVLSCPCWQCEQANNRQQNTELLSTQWWRNNKVKN